MTLARRSHRRTVAGLAVAALLHVAVAEAAPDVPAGAAAPALIATSANESAGERHVLEPAGEGARRTGDLWWTMTTTLAVLYALFSALIVAAAFRRRPAELPKRDDATERRLGIAVTVSGVFTAVVLAVFLVASLAVERAISAIGHEPGAMEIRVTGRQWWWEVQYNDATASRALTTANEIHVPVGVPVHLQLVAADVIHSFWVPSLGGKMDLIPGRDNGLWLRAERAGRFAGQCAEFCGLEHAFMRFDVVAEPKERFDAWFEAQLAPAAAPADDVARRGQDLFVSGPCAMCHTIRGTDAAGRNGPELTHVASRRAIGAGSFPNDRAHLLPWILDAQALKPGTNMPSLAMPAGDVDALVRYLESLR